MSVDLTKAPEQPRELHRDGVYFRLRRDDAGNPFYLCSVINPFTVDGIRYVRGGSEGRRMIDLFDDDAPASNASRMRCDLPPPSAAEIDEIISDGDGDFW